MTVGELRTILRNVESLLTAAEAKKAAKAISDFITALVPFSDETLKKFVELAEKGRTPPPQVKGAGTASMTGEQDEEVVAEVRRLYHSAEDREVTADQIRAACGKLTRFSRKKAQLVSLAESLNMAVTKSMTAPKIIDAITARLLARKGTAIRDTLAGPPEPIHDAPTPAALQD